MSPYVQPKLILFLCLLLVSLAASSLVAQTTYNWSPLFPPTGSFGQGFNWSPGGGPPGELDTAVLNTGGASTATFNYSPFHASLQHQSGNAIFRPSGTNATYSLNGASTISGGSLTINPDGIFKLDVRFSGLTLSGNSAVFVNAGEVSNVGVLNVGSGSAGAINVNGGTINRARGNFNLTADRMLTASNNAQISLGGNWTGAFGTLNLPTLGGGLKWNTSSTNDDFATTTKAV